MIQLPNKTKAFLKKTSLREKLMILVFVAVLTLVWANSWAKRATEWNRERNTINSELEIQEQYLSRRETISTNLNQALERVEPSKTYAASRLAGEIDSLLRRVGLVQRSTIRPVKTKEGEIFNDHNLDFNLSDVSISDFIKLSNELREKVPYINLRSVSINKSRTNPEALDISYKINSFDLKDSIL